MNIQDSLEITSFIKENKGDKTWQELTDLVNETFGTDLKKDAVRGRHRRELKSDSGFNLTPQNLNAESEEYKSNGDVILNKNVYFQAGVTKTPDLILEKLGYDANEFELCEWRFGTWEVAMKDIDGEPTKTECCTIRAKVKPLVNITEKDLLEINKEIITKNVKPLKLDPIKQDNEYDLDKLMVLSIADLHFGSYANKIDSGYDYNLDIQKNMFKNLIQEVINKQGLVQASELLYVVGNDLINFDSGNQTTAKGTVIENCSNFKETYAVVLEEEVRALKTLRQYFDKINVLMCEGNHDKTLNYTLYLNLMTLFSEDEVFNFSEDFRKTQAFKWGNTSLFLDHGDGNYKRLVQQLSNIFPEIYGGTKYRHCLLHHLHSKETNFELNGIEAHRLSSLKPTDKYEFNNAFIGDPKQEIFIFDKETGLDTTMTINGNKLIKRIK